MQSQISQDKKAIVIYSLSNIPFEGWTNKMIFNAFKANKLDPNLASVYFPNGFHDLFVEIINYIDELMLAAIDFNQLKTMKVREKIFYLIKLRITVAQEFRETLKTGISLFINPARIYQGFEILWNSVSDTWKLAGDHSLDFNYYTKRSLLAYVYFTTLLFWFEDYSKNHYLTWRFLENKIEQILRIGQFKNKIAAVVEKLDIKKIPVARYIWAKYS